MKITFVIPFLGISGGVKVLLQYANFMQERGHTVTVVYPWWHTPPTNLKQRLKGPAKGLVNALFRLTGTNEIRWYELKTPLLAVPALSDRYLPDADIIMTTENQTIDALELVSESKGKKVYFIQHYEDWTRDPKLVDATWQSPNWHKITIATWLVKLAKDKFHSSADLIVNGIDLKAFTNKGHRWNTTPRVLSLYHHLEWKGIKDAIAAMKQVQDQGIEFKPVFFGHIPPGDDLQALGEVEYHQLPTGEALRQLYTSCDVFISASWSEGCQAPPMEAMACGCAVIATNVGGVPDYEIAGKTALVVEPKQPDKLAAALTDLLTHPDKMKAIAEAGHTHIQDFTWAKATDKLEAIFKELAGKK